MVGVGVCSSLFLCELVKNVLSWSKLVSARTNFLLKKINQSIKKKKNNHNKSTDGLMVGVGVGYG